ncbi:MAG: hypothetical protein AAF518_26510 [Spirochaetota bacterium]
MSDGYGVIELLSYRFNLPKINYNDTERVMQRIAELEFLEKREVNILARGIVRAFDGE